MIIRSFDILTLFVCKIIWPANLTNRLIGVLPNDDNFRAQFLAGSTLFLELFDDKLVCALQRTIIFRILA